MRILIVFILSLFAFISNASHIVGGDIYYDYLGNNTYRFYISVYRDCNSTGADFDSPLRLGVYTSNGSLYQEIAVPFPGSTYVPVVFNNPCVTPPNNICTENAIYETLIVLPPSAGGYTVTYQRCCRGPNISNINNPDDTGFTLTCKVPGSGNNFHINSSPRFTNYPPLLLCNNEDLIFDHSATDPDGDQLVYSLVTPHSGASSFNAAPNPPPPPPYGNVSWSAGHTPTNPLGPGATINIDPNTGLLTASPNLLGLYVVGIRVSEYRNGTLINSTTRDFLFRVFNCTLQLESILPAQDQLSTFNGYCDGLTIQFENNSYGGTNYLWDFGVPGITTDVSTSFEPTYTYPAPGHYQAMLVVNPGWPCTDTAYMDIYVNNEMTLSYTSQDSLCIFGNNFDFTAISDGPPGTLFEWEFGPNASSPTGTGEIVNNISFSTTGSIDITVNASYNLCEATYTAPIYIYPEPVAEIVVPDQVECNGLTVDFDGVVQNANLFHWDFGINGTLADTSDIEDPTYTFPGAGSYDITFIAGSSAICSDTTELTIDLNEALLVAFTSEDSLCITDNVFNFDGTVSGPPNSVFVWDFGPYASISSSTDIDVPNVTFSQPGVIPITLTGSFDNCVESVTHEIYIFQEPTIDFGILPGLQCAPFTAQFLDSSFAETPIYYSWDFGDGSTSNLQNPQHLFTDIGNYIITLEIRTDAGCIDTLTLTKGDLVNVRPKPVAGFVVDPDYTDICNSSIQFTDLSEGANRWFYWFDDTTFFSESQNPSHLYISDGTHYPYQIVTNEFGCKDTASSQLFIEPFTVYAPNAFTPDGDEFNNTFQPEVYLNVESWHMQIYNRWGQVIWENFDKEVGWDGTFNGKLVETGLYNWKLTYVSCEPVNSERVKTGHVSVLR